MIEKATADMVDIELFSGAEQAEEMIGIAKEKGVKIIMSNHDFQTTPDASTIVNRLRSMQDLGADVAKIAVMPENKMHVVNLLAATAMMQEAYAEVPVVTMSMGKMGQSAGSAVRCSAVQSHLQALRRHRHPDRFRLTRWTKHLH